MPADAILDAHNRRLRELDPLLPTAKPLPAAGPGDVPIEGPGGSALARLTRVDLDSFAATWTAAEEHRLLARAADVNSMADLLAQWEDTLAARGSGGDPDSEAVLSWPSRDAAMVRVFRTHRLVPQATIAVRPSGRNAPPTRVADVTVRPLRARDVDAATRLWLAEVAWDQQFGGPIQRTSETGSRARPARTIRGAGSLSRPAASSGSSWYPRPRRPAGWRRWSPRTRWRTWTTCWWWTAIAAVAWAPYSCSTCMPRWTAQASRRRCCTTPS